MYVIIHTCKYTYPRVGSPGHYEGKNNNDKKDDENMDNWGGWGGWDEWGGWGDWTDER